MQTSVLAPDLMKGWIAMKEKYLAEIFSLAETLSEEQLLYLLTFIEKVFGSH